MGFSQRPADHGEILAEHEHFPAVDVTVASDHPVSQIGAVLPQGAAPACFEDIEFLETALVQKQQDPFSGRELALGVLAADFVRSPAAVDSALNRSRVWIVRLYCTSMISPVFSFFENPGLITGFGSGPAEQICKDQNMGDPDIPPNYDIALLNHICGDCQWICGAAGTFQSGTGHCR